MSRHRAVMLVAIAVGVAGVLLAAYLRFVEPFRPGITTPLGFYEFADQGHYLTTANVLAHWHFPTRPSEYWYGLGYPILGVPFIWLRFEGDPFAPVDALAFGATLAFTFVLGTRVSPFRSFTSALAIGLGAAFTVGLASPLTGLTSVPWNTNIVVPLAAFVFVVATSTAELSWLRAVALGLAIGWIFATRYSDALFVGLVVLAMLGRLVPRERRRLALGGGAALLAIVALVLASQQYTFGNALRTPYHYHVRDGGETDDQSLDEYKLTDVPRHFAGAFVTGENDHGRREPNTSPILRDFPLLVLMPVGAWVLARRRSRTRTVWMTALAASVVSSVLYLSFVAGGGGDLKFGNARYWSMWFPLWAVLAMVGVAAGVGAITRLARGATVA